MSQSRSKTFKKVVFALIAIVLIGIGVKLAVTMISFAPVVYEFAFNKGIDLKQTTDQRVNILLLGVGGGKHDGPYLTDTIIFISIDPSLKEVKMITLPRDLWITDINAKVNTAYAKGLKSGKGLALSKASVGKVLGQKIDYGFRIDFNGFIKAVDRLGGITVNVERTFDDYEYPITGSESDTCGFEGEEFEKRATEEAEKQLEAFPCRYEHLHFDKGVQNMDGETALKYVRSRHAAGDEGTDFARSKRQENVINAVKDKVFSVGTLLDPIKIANLYDVFKDSIDTDIKKEEYDDFVKLAQKMKGTTIESSVIDDSDDLKLGAGLLINPPISDTYGGQYVLVPKKGPTDFSNIHSYVTCFVEHEGCLSPSPSPSKKVN
ncbi:MAG: LCP family protein [Candidatus Levybacteria bacterium]|nr:LCP family protein [Candidatus Levybacteria bacterium]